jgi:hypothetical protein
MERHLDSANQATEVTSHPGAERPETLASYQTDSALHSPPTPATPVAKQPEFPGNHSVANVEPHLPLFQPCLQVDSLDTGLSDGGSLMAPEQMLQNNLLYAPLQVQALAAQRLVDTLAMQFNQPPGPMIAQWDWQHAAQTAYETQSLATLLTCHSSEYDHIPVAPHLCCSRSPANFRRLHAADRHCRCLLVHHVDVGATRDLTKNSRRKHHPSK